MKLHVIHDRQDNIGSLHTRAVSGPRHSISAVGVTPGPGQTLNTITVGDELRSTSLVDMHREERVETGEVAPMLVGMLLERHCATPNAATAKWGR